MGEPVYGALRPLTPQEEIEQTRLLDAMRRGNVRTPDLTRPGAVSPAQTAVSVAYADTEGDARTENPGYAHIGYGPVDAIIASAASMPFTRPASNDEYDDQTRRYNLTRRLQGVQERYPYQYGAASDPYGIQMGEYPSPPESPPTPSPRTAVDPTSYPGMPLAEGLSWWDTTVSLPVNAIRMSYGASDAPQRFSEAADTFLLGLPTFAKHGTFHPERDSYEDAIRELSSGWYKTPWAMKGMRPQDVEKSRRAAGGVSADGGLEKRDGYTGTLQIMKDFGVPETRGTRVGSYMLDALLDPDSGSLNAIRNLAEGVPSAAARNLAADNGLMFGLEGAGLLNQYMVK